MSIEIHGVTELITLVGEYNDEIFIAGSKNPYSSKEECTNKINKYECIFQGNINCTNIPLSFNREIHKRQYFTKTSFDEIVIDTKKIE